MSETIYTNGAFGDMRVDPEWNKQIADMGLGTVVAQMHTSAQSMHSRMVQEQQKADNVMRNRQQQMHDQVAPPKKPQEVLKELQAKIRPPIKGRKLKI